MGHTLSTYNRKQFLYAHVFICMRACVLSFVCLTSCLIEAPSHTFWLGLITPFMLDANEW